MKYSTSELTVFACVKYGESQVNVIMVCQSQLYVGDAGQREIGDFVHMDDSTDQMKRNRAVTAKDPQLNKDWHIICQQTLLN